MNWVSCRLHNSEGVFKLCMIEDRRHQVMTSLQNWPKITALSSWHCPLCKRKTINYITNISRLTSTVWPRSICFKRREKRIKLPHSTPTVIQKRWVRFKIGTSTTHDCASVTFRCTHQGTVTRRSKRSTLFSCEGKRHNRTCIPLNV